ncbi:uncharacterized protein LOC124273239 isoform X1 [Haliotis rubra]|uniref:uncharacterized protein LOC124273239 isoform X1 n=1 Tax=Haliotis rubra TaxID=36100 RepID=UPI001EE5A2D8|nr:uncharacterized protein LOC124273239 isoform X1 [Haliotis rubra]
MSGKGQYVPVGNKGSAPPPRPPPQQPPPAATPRYVNIPSGNIPFRDTSTDTRNTHNKRGRLSEVSLGIAHSVRHHSPLSVISKSCSRNNTNWSRMDMAVLQRKMALRTYNLVMLA